MAMYLHSSIFHDRVFGVCISHCRKWTIRGLEDTRIRQMCFCNGETSRLWKPISYSSILIHLCHYVLSIKSYYCDAFIFVQHELHCIASLKLVLLRVSLIVYNVSSGGNITRLLSSLAALICCILHVPCLSDLIRQRAKRYQQKTSTWEVPYSPLL